jgi:adenylate cyclase
MAEESFMRKLTAVLSADVAAYSRLMGEDEAATVRTLEEYKGVMSELIRQHRGRVVDAPGDNVLAEFASVVDAVQCAVAIQTELKVRNAELPEHRRMRFRIGINLGDVIAEGERIYGDGVNIAARLESLADPGGICVSKTAFDQVESKLPLGYEFLGEQEVKNIARRVGAYRVVMDPRVTVAGSWAKASRVPWWRHKTVLASALVVLVAIVGVGGWTVYWRAPKEKTALPLLGKPAIAVLPFTNMSGDSGQEYFSDGMSESLITRLARFEQLVVIARNSSFKYKGKSVGIKQMGEELGATYVLEGSVQKAGDRVRINVQLIEAATDRHVWAAQYDRALKDIFAVQDEITRRVVGHMAGTLLWGEASRLSLDTTTNPEAYDLYLRALSLFHLIDKTKSEIAIQLLERAIALDPRYAHAMAMLGIQYWYNARKGWTERPDDAFKRAEGLAEQALAIDTSNATALQLSAMLHSQKGDYKTAVALARRAVEVEPNNYEAQYNLAWGLDLDGQFEEAVEIMTHAMRVWPHPPPWARMIEGFINIHAGRYEAAERLLRPLLQPPVEVNFINRQAHLALILALMFQGRETEARREAEKYKEIPEFPFKSFPPQWRRLGFKDPQRLERELAMWRKAGFEE